MIKWLFFDLGSTLIDESLCEEYRRSELLKQENAPIGDVLDKRMREYAALNRPAYKTAAREFGLQTAKWPVELERVYGDAPAVLRTLREKYRLGVIANQVPGTEERLKRYGIRDFFSLIVSSAEAGAAKPDPKIFTLALRSAGCAPEEACMIGDRLDNDIEPAARLGMRTLWVRQGLFAYGDPELLERRPDITVDRIVEILEHL